MKIVKWLLALCFALAAGLVQAEEVVVTVKSGDTVSEIARAHGAKTADVCTRNASQIPNCNHIRPGQKLVVEKVATVAQSQHVAAPAPKTQVSGPIPIKGLNVAPYRLSRTAELDHVVLRSQGWTDAEVAEFHSLEQSGQCVLEAFEAGATMKWMVGAKGKVTTGPSGLVATWEKFHSARVCELATGKRIAIFQICENLAELPPAEPIVIAPPEEPVRPSEAVAPPAPPPREEPAPQPLPPTKAEPEKAVCEKFDWSLLAGVEVEPGYKGADSKALYGSTSAYCMWRGKTGWHGLGAKAQGAVYHGTFGHGFGSYHGRAGPFFGPSYKYISDFGWDMEVGGPMFGTIRDRVEAGAYANRRRFDIAGFSAGINWYQSKLDGVVWNYETQASIFAGLVTGSHLEQSYNGRDLAGTEGMSDPKVYANGSFRHYIHRTKVPQAPILGEVEVYGQLGFLIFDETTGNWRLGMTFMERCVGVGVGQDFHFFHDFVPAVGAWVDVPVCAEVVRTYHRLQQIKADAAADGVTIDPVTGGMTFKDPSRWIQKAPVESAPAAVENDLVIDSATGGQTLQQREEPKGSIE